MTRTLHQDRAELAAAGRRSAYRVAIATLIIGAVAILVWAVAFSPVLGAKRIVVRGVHVLTAAQIRQAAAIRHGTPLLRLDTRAAARRVEALPDVASAHVRISYPSTVEITVSERMAVGYVLAGGAAVLVDGTGRQFRSTPTPPAGLPRFEIAMDSDQIAVGQAVATVAGALPAAIRTELRAIAANTPQAVVLRLVDGRTVLWGGADRSADKAQVLPALLGRPGTIFDVSDPDVVVAR